MKVGLEGLIKLVDAIGGVDFDVPYKMNYDDPRRTCIYTLNRDPPTWTDRKQWNLSGTGACRFDFSRMELQQQFLMVVAKKMLTPKT